MFKKNKADKYSFIIGRDLQQKIGLDIINSKKKFASDNIEIDMMPRDYWNQESISSFWSRLGINQAPDGDKIDSKINKSVVGFDQEYNNNVKILDANYAPVDLNEISQDQTHLTVKERDELKSLLLHHAEAFDQHCGKWKGPPVSFKLKEGYKPFNAKPYQIPHSLTATLKKEVDRLVAEGVLSPVKSAEWASPTFAIPKKDQILG